MERIMHHFCLVVLWTCDLSMSPPRPPILILLSQRPTERNRKERVGDKHMVQKLFHWARPPPRRHMHNIKMRGGAGEIPKAVVRQCLCKRQLVQIYFQHLQSNYDYACKLRTYQPEDSRNLCTDKWRSHSCSYPVPTLPIITNRVTKQPKTCRRGHDKVNCPQHTRSHTSNVTCVAQSYTQKQNAASLWSGRTTK